MRSIDANDITRGHGRTRVGHKVACLQVRLDTKFYSKRFKPQCDVMMRCSAARFQRDSTHCAMLVRSARRSYQFDSVLRDSTQRPAVRSIDRSTDQLMDGRVNRCIDANSARVSQAACELKTKRVFGLTGTLIQNDMKELWFLLHLIDPLSVGEKVTRRDGTRRDETNIRGAGVSLVAVLKNVQCFLMRTHSLRGSRDKRLS